MKVEYMNDELLEELEKEAKKYAWSHNTIGVNKENFTREDFDVSKMVRIPIGKEIEQAVMFGAKWMYKKNEMD